MFDLFPESSDGTLPTFIDSRYRNVCQLASLYYNIYICSIISKNEANASHALLRLFVKNNNVSLIFTPNNTKQK